MKDSLQLAACQTVYVVMWLYCARLHSVFLVCTCLYIAIWLAFDLLPITLSILHLFAITD